MRTAAAKKTVAEALKILTAPGGPCDPYIATVKDPEFARELVKKTLENLVDENPELRRSPEKLVEAFLAGADDD